MRKVFPLTAPNRTPPRVIDAIKGEVGKYLKRERRKPLPEDADYWDFACRTGADRETAEAAHVTKIGAAIDAAAAEDWPAIYIEILAVAGHRTGREGSPAPKSAEEPSE